MTDYNILTAFELGGKDYIALLLHEQHGDDELIFCRYQSLNDEEIEIFEINDDTEFEQVLEFFNTLEVEEQ